MYIVKGPQGSGHGETFGQCRFPLSLYECMWWYYWIMCGRAGTGLHITPYILYNQTPIQYSTYVIGNIHMYLLLYTAYSMHGDLPQCQYLQYLELKTIFIFLIFNKNWVFLLRRLIKRLRFKDIYVLRAEFSKIFTLREEFL